MGLTIGYWGWSDGKKGMLRLRLHLHSCACAGSPISRHDCAGGEVAAVPDATNIRPLT